MDIIYDIMIVCAIIHNMIIEDERDHYLINKCKTIVAWTYFPNLHRRH